MFEKLRSYIDSLNGMGHCECCLLSWNVVEPYSVPVYEKMPKYSTNHIFAVCNKCFHKLPPSSILAYFQIVVDRWNKPVDMEIIKYNIEWLKNHMNKTRVD